MTQPLFRPEVLQAKRTSWLGGISLAQPIRLWVLTAAAVLVAFAVLLFLVFGSYSRRSRVVGHLVPVQGLASVLAPATGVVTRVHVPEGGRVEAGQTVAVISVPRPLVAGGDTVTELQQHLAQRVDGLKLAHSAQQLLLDAQASGLAAQLTSARRELAQIEAEIGTREEQVRLARETLDRLRQLRDNKYVSELQLKQQESTALAHVSEVQILQRQAISTRRMIIQLQQATRELPGQHQSSQAGFQGDLARLEQERLELKARQEMAINAPAAGIIATQLIKPGQAVQAGQTLLSVLPGDGSLEAELLVPSRAIGFIEPGDKVMLRYQAYPYQKFGHHQGRVARISRSTVNTELNGSNSRIGGGEPFYRVNVTLARQTITAYGRPESLKPGMLVDADVLGERRTLIEWVLEPIYSVTGNLVGT